MEEIVKDCTTCIHLSNELKCSDTCKNYSSHEFTCDYCKNRTKNSNKFCTQENDDGSQNCCGDKFELDEVKFKVIEKGDNT